jgi:hypothetical protein
MCITSTAYRAAHGGRIGREGDVHHFEPLACEHYPEAFDKSIGIVAVDETPTMLSDGRAPQLLHWLLPPALLPEVRLIAVLRQPTERLYSIYQHKRALKSKAAEATGWKNLDGQNWLGEGDAFARQTFDHWAAAQLDEWARMDPTTRYDTLSALNVAPTFHRSNATGRSAAHPNATGLPIGAAHGTSSDLMRGYYALPLQRWLEVWPRRQLLILNFHALISSQAHVQSALAFATSGWARLLHEAALSQPGGATSPAAVALKMILHNDVRGTSLPHTNIKMSSASTPSPSCSMEHALDAHYAPHNGYLLELLERTHAQRPAEELPFHPFRRARLATDCPSGPSDRPAEAAGAWSNRPTEEMQRAGAGCSSSAFAAHFHGENPDCNLNALWRRERYCSFHCFVYGLGYHDL